jgi:hypothetical protein
MLNENSQTQENAHYYNIQEIIYGVEVREWLP